MFEATSGTLVQTGSDLLARQDPDHIIQLVRFDAHRTVVEVRIRLLEHTHAGACTHTQRGQVN